MWKIVAGIALIAGVFCAGFYFGKGRREVHIVEKEGKKEIQVVEKVVEKIKIVKANGTVIEKEIFTDKNIHTKKEASSAVEVVKSAESKYTFSGGAVLSQENLNGKPIEYYGGAAMRVFGPFWAEATLKSSMKEMTFGIRMEF